MEDLSWNQIIGFVLKSSKDIVQKLPVSGACAILIGSLQTFPIDDFLGYAQN